MRNGAYASVWRTWGTSAPSRAPLVGRLRGILDIMPLQAWPSTLLCVNLFVTNLMLTVIAPFTASATLCLFEEVDTPRCSSHITCREQPGVNQGETATVCLRRLL